METDAGILDILIFQNQLCCGTQSQLLTSQVSYVYQMSN